MASTYIKIVDDFVARMEVSIVFDLEKRQTLHLKMQGKQAVPSRDWHMRFPQPSSPDMAPVYVSRINQRRDILLAL